MGRAGGPAGRVADAIEVRRPLLGRHHDPGADGVARICLGHILLAQGQVRDALQELERAATSPALPAAEGAAARAWAGFARVSLGDLDGAAASAEKARLAAPAGDDLTVSIAMSTIARIAESRGQLGDAQRTIDEAVRLGHLRTGHGSPLEELGLAKAADELQHWRPDVPGAGTEPE